MRHSKSRCRSPDKSGLRNEHSDISELVEDADESAQVRLGIPIHPRYIGTPCREQAGGTGPHIPFYRLVGTVSNCAYPVRLKTAPTG